jgi:hypothetical protein
MRTRLIATLLTLLCSRFAAAAFPTFKAQELSEKVTVGYAVLLIDINGDKKPDIVVADSKRVIWFENPDWKMHTILEGQTLPDNVALAPLERDGKILLFLAAGWKGYNTHDTSTLQWLEPGSDVAEPWTMHPIPFDQVALHRIHLAMVDGKPLLITAPLLGRGASAKANWLEANPKLFAYDIPANPAKGPWNPKLVTDAFPVTHNFTPVDLDGDGKTGILLASYDGLSLLRPESDGGWKATKIGAGEQGNPNASRGSSEAKLGHTAPGERFIATIEPWHGNEVVVYSPPSNGDSLWTRKVIDSTLKEGHGVWLANLSGTGDDIITCARGGKPGEGRGVFVFTAGADGNWTKHVIDDQDMAGEDLAAADLNGDGKIDIVAVGRATHNVRIYWNQGN